MARSKKEFSKEAMYKKIMPSSMLKSMQENGEPNQSSEDQYLDIDNSDESNIGIANIGKKIISELKKIDNKVYDESDPIVASSYQRKNGIIENADNEALDFNEKNNDNQTNNDTVQNEDNELQNKEKNDNIKGETNNRVETDEENNDYIESIENVSCDDVQDANSNISNINEANKEAKADEIKTVNLMEIMVRDKLENVLKRFKLNNNNVTKDDIVNLTLNNLPTYMFKGKQIDIDNEFEKFRHENYVDVVSAIIKSIIVLRNYK